MTYEKDEIRLENYLKKRLHPNVAIQEYLVDLLGGLLPGILFIIAFIISIFPPLYVIASFYTEEQSLFELANSFFVSIQQTPSAIWLVLFLLFVLLSYVVGHIFYRRDPKTPDRKSFKRLAKIMKASYVHRISKLGLRISNKKNLKLIRRLGLKIYLYRHWNTCKNFNIYLEQDLKENYGCTSVSNCEFPYPFYSEYLKKRGLKHLLKLSIWCEKKAFHRSKTFINILKIRLKYHFPEKFGTITRNEAHIRLASSAWYVSGISIYLGVIGFLISLALCIQKVIIMKPTEFGIFYHEFLQKASSNLIALFLPLIITILSFYLKYNISKFIHYQRLREVFYVLETSFASFRTEEFSRIIFPPYKLI